MAKGSNESPPLEPSTSCDDEDEDYYGLKANDIDVLKENSEMVFNALPKGSKSCSYLCEILSYAIKCKEIIEEKGRIEREDAMEKSSLENALEEEKELRVSLEEKLESLDETNNLIIAKIIKERDHAIVKYKVLKKEKS